MAPATEADPQPTSLAEVIAALRHMDEECYREVDGFSLSREGDGGPLHHFTSSVVATLMRASILAGKFGLAEQMARALAPSYRDSYPRFWPILGQHYAVCAKLIHKNNEGWPKALEALFEQETTPTLTEFGLSKRFATKRSRVIMARAKDEYAERIEHVIRMCEDSIEVLRVTHASDSETRDQVASIFREARTELMTLGQRFEGVHDSYDL